MVDFDTSLNPRWVRAVYHEVSQAAGTDDAIQSDFFSSSDRAEEFLKLRSRCLMSLLKEWAVGTSRITSKDYGATLSVASIDCMVDELAADSPMADMASEASPKASGKVFDPPRPRR